MRYVCQQDPETETGLQLQVSGPANVQSRRAREGKHGARWPTAPDTMERGDFGPWEIVDKPETAETGHSPMAPLVEAEETKEIPTHTLLGGWFRWDPGSDSNSVVRNIRREQTRS